MTTMRFKLTRDVTKRESIPGFIGHRRVKIGEEEVNVELSVDMDKLAGILGRKIRQGQKQATMASGAVRLRVIHQAPMRPVASK